MEVDYNQCNTKFGSPASQTKAALNPQLTWVLGFPCMFKIAGVYCDNCSLHNLHIIILHLNPVLITSCEFWFAAETTCITSILLAYYMYMYML